MDSKMKLNEIDKYLATTHMGFEHLDHFTYLDKSVNSEIAFMPTRDIEDAFHLIYKLQKDWAWSMAMNNEACEVEVQFGRGYHSDKSVPLAICIAILKHFKVDLRQF